MAIGVYFNFESTTVEQNDRQLADSTTSSR